VECLDRLYLNGHIGKLANGGGLIGFMCGDLGKPVPSPVAGVLQEPAFSHSALKICSAATCGALP